MIAITLILTALAGLALAAATTNRERAEDARYSAMESVLCRGDSCDIESRVE
jgi:hypothetical protein